MKRVALYARVSTTGQTVENQLRELEDVGSRLGWSVVATFTDEGISGAKGREHRPALDRLFRGVARREFDLVAAWSVDRLGRSLQELVTLLNELRHRNIDLYLHQQGLDTTTPSGRAMYQMLGVFSEFERAIMVERIKSGMTRAAAEGKRVSRPRIPEAKRKLIERMAREKQSIRAIAREAGVSVGTVTNYVKALG